jgi:hypothetical protein
MLSALAEATERVELGPLTLCNSFRHPAALGVTALIGLWFPDLQAQQPSFFDQPLVGTAPEIAAAMRGYAELGVPHIMFIMFACEQYAPRSAPAADRGPPPLSRHGAAMSGVMEGHFIAGFLFGKLS